jgi:hypothetical protein
MFLDAAPHILTQRPPMSTVKKSVKKSAGRDVTCMESDGCKGRTHGLRIRPTPLPLNL